MTITIYLLAYCPMGHCGLDFEREYPGWRDSENAVKALEAEVQRHLTEDHEDEEQP